MGVKNLWKLIDPFGIVESPNGKRLAIDTSIWIHQLKSAPESLIIYTIAKRILKILYNDIDPIFVFDGKIPDLKRKTMEARKQEEVRILIRDIIANKKCKSCGESMRTCKHISSLKGEIVKEIDQQASERIKNHKYNWGELSNESDYLDDTGNEYSDGVDVLGVTSNTGRYNSLSIEHNNSSICNSRNGDHLFSGNSKIDTEKRVLNVFDFYTKDLQDDFLFRPHRPNSVSVNDVKLLENKTKTQKLRKLVEMRENRKHPLFYDTTTVDAFSESQIENVKRRNLVSRLIKELNDGQKMRVQSDCRVYTEFEVFSPCTKVEVAKKAKVEENVDETSEKTLDDLFDAVEFREEQEHEYTCAELERESRANESHELIQADKSTDHHTPSSTKVSSGPLFKDSHGKFSDDFHMAFKAHHAVKLDESSDIIEDEQNSTYLEAELVQNETGYGIFNNINLNNQNDECSTISRENSDYLHENEPGFKSSDGHPSSLNQLNIDQSIDGDQQCKIKPEHEDLLETISHKILEKTSSSYINDPYSLSTDTQRIQDHIKSVLKVFNVSTIDSPYESDSQCAYLFNQGLVDGVVTEDSDLILYGATVFKNFFNQRKSVVKYDVSSICKSLDLDQRKLLKLSYLLGSDYCLGVKGIGIKKAMQSLDSVGDKEIQPIEDIYLNLRAYQIPEYKNGLISPLRARAFFEKSGLDDSKIKELMFYVEKLKERSCKTEKFAI